MHYCQAWHLVWDGIPLFEDTIEAWASGPMIPSLYNQYRGRFTLSSWPAGHPDRLNIPELETAQVVVDTYGQLSGPQLSTLTCHEQPWQQARAGLHPLERADRQIATTIMQRYYHGVADDPDAQDIADVIDSITGM